MTDEELNIVSDLLDSWKEFNWEPEWFDWKKIDIELYSRILRFQKSHHLEVTGIIDYKTYEKLYTVRSPDKVERERGRKSAEIQTNKITLLGKDYSMLNTVQYDMQEEELKEIGIVKSDNSKSNIYVGLARTTNEAMYNQILKQKQKLPHFVIDVNAFIYQYLGVEYTANDNMDIRNDNTVIVKVVTMSNMNENQRNMLEILIARLKRQLNIEQRYVKYEST
ncbi:Peptidoglycan binding-like [uncultured Caudovirales phage]|jgi:hypothetical protein|uniref:Peptidoglycan binding-like n=1 Tax=uncultured Caudovirales phage TaxID=2100421 RepID=A0A6J5NXU5_9CAUD|nr:Peptidoglycan binding-like [uncultured Caudovirales phage]